MKNKYLSWMAAAGFAAGLLAVVPALASAATQPTTPNGWGGGAQHGAVMHGGMKMAPGVFGTVSAINGTTLTVTSNKMMRPNATTTPATTVYTVDGSSAKVLKNGTSSVFSAIATGDMVMVQGTVTGTNVAATVIRDGFVPGMMGRGGMSGGFGHGSTSTQPVSPIQGNGEPVVAGSIASINGTTLTVSNASNVTYTVDASSAKIVKNGTTTAASALATGDSVVIQGTVNGTSITASSVIDQGANAPGSAAAGGRPSVGSNGGFLGVIGSFFKHIFGF